MQAHFNVLLYPETAECAARHCEKALGQPYTRTVPIGVAATRDFIEEVAALANTALRPDESRLRQPWWAASVDSTYLTGKRVFLFGDATHVMAAARIARDEIGFEVVGMGCYNREHARALRAAAKDYGLEALITDDYLEVEAAIAALHPELILGTQMERHIGKRLGIPCAVISAPVHVQDFPARYSPADGVRRRERDLRHLDSSAGDGSGRTPAAPCSARISSFTTRPVPRTTAATRRAPCSPQPPTRSQPAAPAAAAEAGSMPAEDAPVPEAAPGNIIWLSDAEKELKKIPFFVRGKARRNTEAYAADKGLHQISIDTLYEAKAHYAR